MSGVALVWAANVRGLKPATKIVLIQLSDRHNKDTGRCDPSIKTLSDDCEMDRTTVMRHLTKLEELGLLTRVTRGREDGGRDKNSYILHMPKQEVTTVSEATATQVSLGVKSQNATGVKSQNDGGLSRNFGGVKSQSYATLTCKEPVSEPEEELSLFGEADQAESSDAQFESQFAEFWQAFPTGRKTDKPKAIVAFKKALDGKLRGVPKVDAATIIAAAKRYAASNPDPNFVPIPTTWLNGARWDQWPEVSDLPRRSLLGPQWGEVVR
jgi:predicted transcriptional regulator